MDIKVNVVHKRTRERSGLTQKELAQAIGTTTQQVSRWENGSCSKLVEFFYWMLASEPGKVREVIRRAVDFRVVTEARASQQPISTESSQPTEEKPSATKPEPASTETSGVGFCG